MNRKETIYFEAEAHDEGLSGIVMPYGEPAKRLGYRLAVERGAFKGKMNDVVVNKHHDPSLLLGRTGPKGNVNLTDSPDQLLLSMRYPDTQAGRDAKVEVELGMLAGFSAELTILEDEWQGGDRIVKAAELHGIGLVARPAMKGAVLLSEEHVQMSNVFPMGTIKLQSRRLEGELLWDDRGILSMARKQAVSFRKDSLETDMPITLMLGSDYNMSAANTKDDGSLTVRKTNKGLSWRVNNMPRTQSGEAILEKARRGLITGWRAGFVPRLVEKKEIEINGFEFTLDDVISAVFCEVRLTSDGTGGYGPIKSARRNRRGR